jgi:hypothetical protein
MGARVHLPLHHFMFRWPGDRPGEFQMAGKPVSKQSAKKGAKVPPAMKYLQTRLTEPSWKELKMLSIEAGESLQTLVVAALNDLMVRHGKKPIIAGPSEDEE